MPRRFLPVYIVWVRNLGVYTVFINTENRTAQTRKAILRYCWWHDAGRWELEFFGYRSTIGGTGFFVERHNPKHRNKEVQTG